MKNHIAQDFTFPSLMRFVFPTIIMMVFMSLYTIVDGIFVSRLLGSNALSSLNIVYPILSGILAIGIMLGTGGSAIIARKLGENKKQEAYENFSLISVAALVISAVICLLIVLFLEPLCRILGANDLLLQDSKTYLLIMGCFAPITMMQLIYQTLFVTASKPALGLSVTIIGGISNMVLDYVFMGPMQMGIAGAALATGIGQLIPVIVGSVFFFTNHNGLHYVLPKWNGRVLFESCTNGSSEMVSNLSNAVITYLFNLIMMRLLKENGVAAITIVLYAQFLFNGLYLGFSVGVAPIISYHYGAQNSDVLRRLYRICMRFIIGSSIVVVLISMFCASALITIFTTPQDPTHDIALHGFYLFAINFLFAGINIFASALFTAFSNGKVSAIISFLRTFVIIVACVLILPSLIGVDGVWLSIPLAELLTLFVSLLYLRLFKDIYQYG